MPARSSALTPPLPTNTPSLPSPPSPVPRPVPSRPCFIHAESGRSSKSGGGGGGNWAVGGGGGGVPTSGPITILPCHTKGGSGSPPMRWYRRVSSNLRRSPGWCQLPSSFSHNVVPALTIQPAGLRCPGVFSVLSRQHNRDRPVRLRQPPLPFHRLLHSLRLWADRQNRRCHRGGGQGEDGGVHHLAD